MKPITPRLIEQMHESVIRILGGSKADQHDFGLAMLIVGKCLDLICDHNGKPSVVIKSRGGRIAPSIETTRRKEQAFS
jgi:hypothetical protein